MVENRFVIEPFLTNAVHECRPPTEMTPVKAALLSFAMLAAICISAAGIYSADASGGHAVVDGYGITAFKQ